MNRIKFISMWLLIFGVLAIFSFASIGAITGTGTKKAFAATINSDDKLRGANNLIAVDDPDDHGFNGRQMLCTVDNSQLQFLQSRYGATVKQVDINGTTTSFVAIPKQPDINQHILKSILGETHCHIVQVNNVLYLFFRSEVS
jgi:hypothetical protein